VYFQVANLAEQHHRVRRRRDYELEGRSARDSLESAFATLGDTRPPAVALELVLTAHPTEATRRTVLAAHQRMARLLDRLDDERATERERLDVEERLAAEVTALWQTDEVRALAASIGVATRMTGVSDELLASIERDERELPDYAAEIGVRNDDEPYRRKLSFVWHKLDADTRAGELADDLAVVDRSLRA